MTVIDAGEPPTGAHPCSVHEDVGRITVIVPTIATALRGAGLFAASSVIVLSLVPSRVAGCRVQVAAARYS